MTSYYRFSEQERDEAAAKVVALSISVAKLEGLSDEFKNNENYEVALKKLKAGIRFNQHLIDTYNQQLIEEACEHEWIQVSAYESRCNKCNGTEWWG